MQEKTKVSSDKKVTKKQVKKGTKKIVTKSKKINKTKTSLKDKQISIFSLIFLAAIIAIVIGLYIGIKNLVITLKYKEYTEKMNTYGYNVLYNNLSQLTHTLYSFRYLVNESFFHHQHKYQRGLQLRLYRRIQGHRAEAHFYLYVYHF